MMATPPGVMFDRHPFLPVQLTWNWFSWWGQKVSDQQMEEEAMKTGVIIFYRGGHNCWSSWMLMKPQFQTLLSTTARTPKRSCYDRCIIIWYNSS